MIQIKNTVEDEVIGEFANVNDFVDFVNMIKNENEDFDFSILGKSDAEEYILDYCDNLELNITPEKAELIEEVHGMLVNDILAGDSTLLEELLSFVPNHNLIEALPENEWERYKSLRDE